MYREQGRGEGGEGRERAGEGGGGGGGEKGEITDNTTYCRRGSGYNVVMGICLAYLWVFEQ